MVQHAVSASVYLNSVIIGLTRAGVQLFVGFIIRATGYKPIMGTPGFPTIEFLILRGSLLVMIYSMLISNPLFWT